MKKDIITMKSCWYYNQYTLLLFLLFTITNLPVTTITIYLFIYLFIYLYHYCLLNIPIITIIFIM